MEKFIYTSYATAMDALVEKISALPVDIKRPKIIIVPEIYTFLSERTFYSLGKGSFDVRVCSLTKLYHEWCEQDKAIGRQGAIALIRKILTDCKDQLTYYRRSYDKKGFACKVYETVEKLYSSQISPDSLVSESERDVNKLHDIKLVYERYLEATSGQFVDSTGRIYALTEFVKQNPNKISSTDFYFANFDVFSKAQTAFIEALDKHAHGVSLYCSAYVTGYYAPKGTVVYSATSTVDELKRVACEIKNEVFFGSRYGDIAVLGEGIGYETLKRIFDENKIPFYYDKKITLDGHELGRLLLTATECAMEGLRREKMVALARNSFVLSAGERDAFCRYALENMTNFGGFRKAFERESEFTGLAEKARRKMINVIDKVSFPRECTAGLLARGLEEILNGVICKDQEDEKMRDLAKSTVNMIRLVFGDSVYAIGELLDAVKEAFAGVGTSVIPNESDTVFVGPLNSRRGFRCKRLFIMGFNDGVLPKQSELPDLIGEELSDALKAKGVMVEPRVDQMNERFRDEVMQVISGAEKLFISYVLNGSSKKSYLLSLIERVNHVTERDGAYYESLLRSGDAQAVAGVMPTESACIERALLGANDVATRSANEASKHKIEALTGANEKSVEMLDGGCKISHTSVTRIQTYFDCPRKYFFRYILNVNKTLSGEVNVMDIGTVIHAIVENFVAGMDSAEDSRAFAERVTEQVVADFDKSLIDVNARMIERIKSEAVELCLIAEKQILDGEFSVFAAELEYNDVKLELPDGAVFVTGKIDRVDRFDGNVRVIDYKTGSQVGLSLSDVYYGKKLQLPVYARAMENRGYECVGLFYFPVGNKSDGKLTGYCLSDDDIICAMDKNAFVDGNSNVFKFTCKLVAKTGEFKKSGDLLDKNAMRALVDYAIRVSTQALAEIKGGNVKASPRINSCDYCDYAFACKKQRSFRQMNGGVTVETIEEAIK